MSHPVRILDNALDAVGKTPLIRLDKIAQLHGLKCNLREYPCNSDVWIVCRFCRVVGKAEFLSVGGSVKDRIAKAMVEAAEKDGTLIPGQSVVIEPTSGNTGLYTPSDSPIAHVVDTFLCYAGIGLALACAIKVVHTIYLHP